MTFISISVSIIFLFLGTIIDLAHAGSSSRHVRRNDTTASQLINAAIDSLGGYQALLGLQGVTYQSNDVFRVRSIMQNFHLFETDRYVVSSGLQNVSFSFQNTAFKQRIDRSFVSSDLFIFVRPELSPRNFSLVSKSGSEGFACFVQGNNNIFFPKNQTYGYVDAVMTEYLLLQAHKRSPKLLLEVNQHDPTATTLNFRGVTIPAVIDEQLNITVAFDPATNLPLLVRTFEDHPILGLISNDLHFFNYTQVDGLQLPRTQKTIYGDEAVVEETVVSQIYVNPPFEQDYFDGLALDETETAPSAPKPDPKVGHFELSEYWSNTLWDGVYPGTIEYLNVTHPAPDLPKAHHLAVMNKMNLFQLVLEFEESVIVFEAPPHQSDIVIQWVAEKIKKPISHLWVSHHHHDHNLDVAKFVKIGASVIIPEMAAPYWSKIPGINLITFTEEKPYIHSDGIMQARFLWQPDTPHSEDWTYAVVTKACPDANSSMLAYTADAVTTNFETDPQLVDSWLLQAMNDGLSKNTIVVPAHGWPISLSQASNYVGYPYPDLNTTSWVTGGNICLDGA